MKITLLIAVLTSGLLIAGCASHPPMVWYKPGVSAQQTQQDFAQARILANLQTDTGNQTFIPGNGSVGAMIYQDQARNNRRNDLVRDLMMAKGYLWVPSDQAHYPVSRVLDHHPD